MCVRPSLVRQQSNCRAGRPPLTFPAHELRILAPAVDHGGRPAERTHPGGAAVDDDLARAGLPGRASLAIAAGVLALIGLAGGATIAWLTGTDSGTTTVGAPVRSSSLQAGLDAPSTEPSRAPRRPSPTTAPATSTARVSSEPLPTSSSDRPPAPAPAAPAPAATPPVARVPVQVPAPAPYRPAPAPVAPRAPAPAPAPPPPPPPAPAPPPVIDLGPRLPVVPQAPIAPKDIWIG